MRHVLAPHGSDIRGIRATLPAEKDEWLGAGAIRLLFQLGSRLDVRRLTFWERLKGHVVPLEAVYEQLCFTDTRFELTRVPRRAKASLSAAACLTFWLVQTV